MTETEAMNLALSLVALHDEERTDDMQALLDTVDPSERALVFLCLVCVASRFARMLIEFNGLDADALAPEWLRAIALDIDEAGQ